MQSFKYFYWIFFIFSMIGGLHTVYAEDKAILQSSTQETNAKEQDTALPQPEKLVSGWWDYFDVPADKLAKHINEAEHFYEKSIKQSSPETIELAAPSLRNLLGNLKALLELRNTNHLATPPSPPQDQLQYSIDQWLERNDALRKAEWDLQERQTQLNNAALTLNAAQNRLNALMLDYIAMEFADSKKFLLGLDIMAKRSAMAVGDEQLKINKNLLEQQGQVVEILQRIVKSASSQLTADKTTLQQIEQKIQDLQKKTDQAKTSAHKALIDTLGVVEQTPQALSTSRLRNQQAINAMIEETALTIELDALYTTKSLATLLALKDKDVDTNTIGEQLQMVQHKQEQQRQSINNWNKETTDELNQVQEAIIRLTAESQHNDDLAQLLKQRLKIAQIGLVGLKRIESDNDELGKLLAETRNRLIEHSGYLSKGFAYLLAPMITLKNTVMGLWLEPLFTIGDTPVTTAGISRVVLIISFAALVSSLFQRVMRHLTERREESDHGHVSVFYTVGRLAHYLILFVGIIIALSSIGLDFTNLALVAGALSLGIGFGLQSIVNNFVSGLILLFEGTIKVGDFIELESNISGIVREINVRSTQISTSDGIDIIVPNSTLASNQVINWTLREAIRRIHVPFSVAYGTDKELVEKAVLEAAFQVPYTHHPHRGKPVQCWLVKFGDNGLHFELVVWINQDAVKRPAMVQAAYLWEIDSALKKYDIAIPFPQREIHVRTIDGRPLFE